MTQDSNIDDFRPLFIVGNSRSGTTMLGRILGNHPDIYKFNELHFFEQLWNPEGSKTFLSNKDAEFLAAQLLAIQRDGYLSKKDKFRYLKEAKTIIDLNRKKTLYIADVFKFFLQYETNKNGRRIPCDQTPRNVFYIREILQLYPNAQIINIIRDPRDVLSSQKNKWRRRYLGASNIPLTEALRSRINYHPVTISKLWNSAINAAQKFNREQRVHFIYFEKILENPRENIQELCKLLKIPFYKNMLEIPRVGSSQVSDSPKKKGINSKIASSWKRKGRLTNEEIYLCQLINKSDLLDHNYPIIDVYPNKIKLTLSLMILPLQLAIAFVINLKRMRNKISAVKKRLGWI